MCAITNSIRFHSFHNYSSIWAVDFYVAVVFFSVKKKMKFNELAVFDRIQYGCPVFLSWFSLLRRNCLTKEPVNAKFLAMRRSWRERLSFDFRKSLFLLINGIFTVFFKCVFFFFISIDLEKVFCKRASERASDNEPANAASKLSVTVRLRRL